MEFASKLDALRATAAALRYLQPLVSAFEDGLVTAGFEIVARRQQPGGRISTPVLVLRYGEHDVEMHLGNAIEDFLFMDRDEEPTRVDPDLDDPEYAQNKIDDMVQARIELMLIALMPEDDPERDDRLREVTEKFEWIRIARRDGGGEEDS